MNQRSFFDAEFERDMAVKRGEEIARNAREDKDATAKALSILQSATGLVSGDVFQEAGFVRRGAPQVQELRDMGHSIRSEKGGYLYLGLAEVRVPVSDEMKARYYETLHWKERRRKRIAMDSGECCWCKRTDDLQVHHWCYDLFAESLLDLMTLCRECHEQLHSYRGVKLAFPRWVSEQIAEQIQRGVA